MNFLNRPFILGIALTLHCVGAMADIITNRIHFDHQLDVEVINGYPHDLNQLDDHVTIGFVFRNQGDERRLSLRLSGDINIQQQVSLPAGETQRLFLYLPYTNNDDFRIYLTDTRTGASIKPYYLRGEGGYYSSRNEPIYTLGRLGAISVALNVAEPWVDIGRFDTERKMPDHWRGLSGVTAIVTEINHLQQAHDWKTVVMDWLAMGGVLLLASETPLIDWDNVLPGRAFSWEAEPGRLNVGLGKVIVIPPSLLSKIDSDFDEVVGLAPTNPYSFESSPAQSNLLLKSLLSDTGRAPRGLLFAMLMAFAIIVGPLCWWYLIRRRGQPFRYILSVVTISLVFCVVMLTAALLFEGVTPKGKTRSLRLFDLTADREITLAQTAMFAPMQYGTMIEAPADATVIHFTGHEFYYQRTHYTMHTNGILQQLDGMLSVRRRQALGMRRLAPLEGKLVIQRDGDALRVENYLHTTLMNFSIRDDEQFYRIKRLERGGVTTVQPTQSSNVMSQVNSSENLMVSEASELMTALDDRALSKHYFFGQLEQSVQESFLMVGFGWLHALVQQEA
ncbi:MAG: hypothetical protein AAF512_23275, partial [Pseudomonadota bacterium]